MSVRIARPLADRILAHAAATPAIEVCGLLFGSGNDITGVAPAANVAADPTRRFEIDPQALFAAIRAERTGGPRLIGHYHSHPSGDPIPSPCDAAVAEPGRLWLIAGGGRIMAWRSVAGGPLHGAFAALSLAIHG